MKTLTTLILILSLLTATSQTIHVTPTGTGDGSSWANATTLEKAVTIASSGQAIWVQAGTYNLSATLVVPQNVRLYGGFVGTETQLSQRNFAEHPTILDAGKHFSAVTLGIVAVLSGVTVQNGVANTPDRMNGGGVLMHAGSRIEYSYILNNIALQYGGGVYAVANAEIFNSVIAHNRAGIDGFAVAGSHVLFRNNTVTENGMFDCDAYARETIHDTICAGESITLSANTIGTYLWSTGATTASITTPNLTTHATFTVTVTTPTLCVVTETFVIAVNPVPTVTVSVNPPSASPFEMVTFTAVADPPGGTFIWDDVSATTGAVLTVQMPMADDLQFTVNYNVNGCYAEPFMATATNTVCTPSVIAGATLTVDDPSLCLGLSTTLRLTGGIRNSGEWVLFSGSCGGSSATEIARSTANNPIFTVTPTSTTTFFVRGEGCDTQTTCVQVQVTVLPQPMPTTAPKNTLCIGETLPLANHTAGGGTWSLGLDGGLTFVLQTISTVVVRGVSAGATTVVFTAANGCQATYNLEVLEVPTPIVGDTNFCQGQSRLLTSSPAGGTWSTLGGSTVTVNAAGLVTASATLTGNTVIQYTHPTTDCAVSRTVVVHQQPSTPSAASNQVCVSNVVALNPGTPAGGTWSITPAHLASFNAEFTQITGLVAGAATVRYQLNTHCYATFALTILPSVANLAYATALCQGGTSAATASPPGGTWTSTAPAIATVDATTGIFTGLSPGTFQLIYTTPNGCTQTSSIITVNPAPAPITGHPAVGVGLTTQLTTSPPGGIWLSLNPAVATVGAAGLVTGVSSGVTTIRYTLLTGNCHKDFSITVDDCATLALAPGSTANQSVCLNAPILNITYTLTHATQAKILWSPFPPIGLTFNSQTQTISGTPIVSGVFTYTITSINHSSACNPVSISGTITVFDAVSPGTISSIAGTNFDICSGEAPAEFTSATASSGGNPVGASYQWQISTDNVVFNTIAGATSPNFQSPALTETRHFRRIFKNSCPVGISTTNTITVNVDEVPELVGTMAVTPDTTICSPHAGGDITISPTFNNQGISPTFQWATVAAPGGAPTHIPGAISQNLTLTTAPTATTIYRVTVTNTQSSCETHFYQTITTMPQVTIITHPVGGSTCVGQAAITLSLGAASDGHTYQWQRSTDNVNFTNISGQTSNTLTVPSSSVLSFWYRIQVARVGGICPPIFSNSAQVNVLNTPTVASVSGNQRCAAGVLSLSATANPATANIRWFTSQSGGTSLGSSASGANWTTPNITATTTYWVEAHNATCASPNRTSVVATVLPAHVITRTGGAAVQSVCQGSAITAINFTFSGGATGGTIAWTGPAGASAPAGLTANANGISGTVAANAVAGTYNFTVTSTPSGGICAPTTSTGTITVNTTPAAVAVNAVPGCGSAVLNASGGAGGTIFWQGTANNGTSTATPSTSQTVTATGTYRFRARSGAGCWGTQGSVTVSIIAQPHTLTRTGGAASQSVVQGTAIAAITWTRGGSATAQSITWSGTANPNTPPAGITVSNSGATIVISGIPLVQGIFTYMVSTNTGGPCAQVMHSGTITVTIPAPPAPGCNPAHPNWLTSIGTVTWGNTLNTNINAGVVVLGPSLEPTIQRWSAPVFATACAKGNATNNNAFVGGSAGNFNADCRQSLHTSFVGRIDGRAVTGDFFSWCAVMAFADQLCPPPWRVPTREDFMRLSVHMGLNPSINQAFPLGYIGLSGDATMPEIGGAWSGIRFTGWASSLMEEISLHWSSSTSTSEVGLNQNAIFLSVEAEPHSQAAIVFLSNSGKSRASGLTLRCVRDN